MDKKENPRYINPFTDFGFKKIFGEEPNKDLLIDFLNELLREEHVFIQDLTYLKNEKLGNSKSDRKAIFDLYCTNQHGEKFIVELQKTEQKYFKDRSLYYATFPIIEQAQRGEWDYQLKAVYTIAILDFVFDEDEAETEKYRYNVKLSDIDTNKIFYDKLKFIYLEMPKFNKHVDQLTNHMEKWLYVLRHLHKLQEMPKKIQEKIFKKLFEIAELANLTPSQARSYRDSVKSYQDIKNSIVTAQGKGLQQGIEQGRLEGRLEGLQEGRLEGLQEGRLEGLQEGRLEGIQARNLDIAKNMLTEGISLQTIQKITGLPQQTILELQHK